MNKRDIVIGFVILAVLAGVVYFSTRKSEPAVPVTPETLSSQDQLQQKFNYQIPAGADRADLSDVSGGNGTGLATRQHVNATFEYTVIADLPDPATGEFYEAWVGKDGNFVPLGAMRVAKGGWIVNFSSTTDYSDYNDVIVTQEATNDQTPETHILEGSF